MAKINEKGKVGFGRAWADYFKGYVDFRGRSTRAGFWWVQLIYLPVILILTSFVSAANKITSTNAVVHAFTVMLFAIPLLLVVLGFLLPQIAVEVRRLRDAGFSTRGIVTLLVIYGLCNLIFQSSKTSGANIPAFIVFMLALITGITLFIGFVSKSDGLTTEHKSFFFRQVAENGVEPVVPGSTIIETGQLTSLDSEEIQVVSSEFPPDSLTTSLSSEINTVSVDSEVKTQWDIDKSGKVSRQTEPYQPLH